MSFKGVLCILLSLIITANLKAQDKKYKSDASILFVPYRFPLRKKTDDRQYHKDPFLPYDGMYYSWIIETGQGTLHLPQSPLPISIPYQVKGSQTSKVYNSTLQTAGGSFTPTYTFGLEIGSTRKYFGGMNILVYDMQVPQSKFGDNISFEFFFGRNIRLNKRFTLRPSILIDDNFAHFNYAESINNSNQEITALGAIFPSTYQTKTGYANNKDIIVQLGGECLIYKARLDLNYRITPMIDLTAGVGYGFTNNQSTTVGLKSNSTQVEVATNSEGVSFYAPGQENKIFNYDGLYWTMGIHFIIPIGGKMRQ